MKPERHGNLVGSRCRHRGHDRQFTGADANSHAQLVPEREQPE